MEIRESPASSIKKIASRGVYVKKFMELENGSVSCMSNGVVCLDIQGSISLFNKQTSNYIFFTKDSNGKEIKSVFEEDEVPPELQ